MSKIKRDFLGNIPQIGNIIIFASPKKGLFCGKCVNISSTGCPEIEILDKNLHIGQRNNNGNYSVKKLFFCYSANSFTSEQINEIQHKISALWH